MLIEDSPDTRDLVKMVLELNGHSVLSAETGEAGMIKLERISARFDFDGHQFAG
jgi:DNA-binding response OmpR family regulator